MVVTCLPHLIHVLQVSGVKVGDIITHVNNAKVVIGRQVIIIALNPVFVSMNCWFGGGGTQILFLPNRLMLYTLHPHIVIVKMTNMCCIVTLLRLWNNWLNVFTLILFSIWQYQETWM